MDIRHAVGVKAGIPAEKLAALEEYATRPEFSKPERVALEFAERVLRDDQEVTDESFARLREYFTEPEILELAFVVGFQTFASKFAKAFQLVPQGFSQA